MAYYGKGFNDGVDDDVPRFIPHGNTPVDFIPVGQEDKYIQDNYGNWWSKSDWEKMRLKQ